MNQPIRTTSKSIPLWSRLAPIVAGCLFLFRWHHGVQNEHEAKRQYIQMYEREASFSSQRESSARQGIRFPFPSGPTNIPSWATRKKTWLGLGPVEWTVSEKTFFGGTKTVLYQIKNGVPVEQVSEK